MNHGPRINQEPWDSFQCLNPLGHSSGNLEKRLNTINTFVKFLLKSFSLILEHNLENEAVLISKGSFVYLLSYAYALIDSENLAFEIFEDCHCCRISS